MLLAIDIGNTNVVLALLDAEDRVLEERRAPSKDGWTAEQYAAQIRALLCGRAVRGAAVSSVVPELTGVLSAAAREAAGVTALVVNSDSPVGLTLAIEQPETLGADILAADAAAAEEYPLPVIVFDFGTATTVTVVDEQRRYRGGVILPGIKLGMQALFTGTAQLPDIRIEAPAHVICTETAPVPLLPLVGGGLRRGGHDRRPCRAHGERAGTALYGGRDGRSRALCRAALPPQARL